MSSLLTPLHHEAELRRLDALHELDVLDTAPDPDIDRLTALVASCLDMPICLVALADQDRFWLKSRHGVDWHEYPLQDSLCEPVLMSQQGVVCPHLGKDSRWRQHPLTQRGPQQLLFYAGEPLWSGTEVIGTLCVLDRRPRRDFGADQRHRLQAFAQVVSDALRNRQQRRLAEWERALHTLGPTATLLWMMDGPTPRLAHRSDNLPHIVGVEAARLLAAGAPLNALCHPADADVVRAIMSPTEGSQPHHGTFRLKHDGRWVRMLTHADQAQPPRLRAYLTDVSAQQALEAHNEATREHLQLALEAAQIGTWELNLQTGERLHGPRTIAMLGYEPDELQGDNTHWTELIHPADRDMVRTKISRRLALSDEQLQQLPVFSVEYRIRHKQGRYVWVQSYGKLVSRDEQGQPLRAVGTLMDITHAKVAERQRTQRQRVLDLVNTTQRAFLHGQDLKAAFDLLFEPLLDLTDSPFGFIGVVQRAADGRMSLRVPTMTDLSWDETSRHWHDSHMDTEGGLVFTQLDNLFGHVVTHDKVVISHHHGRHSASRGTPSGHPVIDSFMGLPLRHQNKVVGMIALANRSEGYTEEMVALLEPLAQMLGALIKARADEDARSKAAALWREQATVDSLTGLANRRRFFDLVARHIPQVRRYGGQATIVLMDLDHFKRINDTHGHASGDLVLKAFGKLLAASVRDTDLAARIGGEEFAIFMPSTSPHEALIPLERIRQRWASQPTECEGHSVAATVSIGVAGWSPGSDSPEQWLTLADEALYQAKGDGRNCIRVAG
ncbi:diguanylate cyclase [Aquabacterium sp. A3]|uniref:diguanylate cyclase n=1 Tax=Aquabacterium sp. A3 TaxID=3132829 RepID=UPI00311A07D7